MRRLTLTIFLLAACASPAATTAPTTTTEATTTTQPTTTTTRPTTTTAVSFDLDNFSVELIVTESECFGSAGALVTVEPEMTVVNLPPDDYRATLVFEIHGGEADETANLEIDGAEYSYDELLISTASCDYELSVELVRLIER